MRLTNWLTKFATFSCISPRKSRFAQTRRHQAGVGNPTTAEVLEQRALLTTFEVTTLAESGAGDGETSLREAIAEANSQAGADEIVFADGLQGRITLGSGQLGINDDLTISGPAANLLTIDGGDKFRVFDVTGGNDLTLNNLTIANGRTAGSNQRGAGIRLNSGTLTVNNSTISGNTTLGSGSGGAGIHSTRGSVFLHNSTVSYNAVEGGGSFAYGGGIFSSEGSLTLTNSTVARNSAALGGGGIVFDIADVTIVNSTISGNTTSGSGGGIKAIENFNYVDLPTLSIHNSIVAGNSGNASGPDAHTTGGGISVGVFAQSSLIGDSTGSGWSTANLLNVDFTTVVETEVIDGNTVPTLGDNGGPTRTIALLVDSPAIDSGSNSLAKDKDGNDLTTDGRGTGFARTVDGNDDGSRVVDMGAFEAPFLGDLIVSTNTDIVDGDYSDGELSLREALVAANNRPGADQVTFAANVSGFTILLTNGQLEVTDDLTITGPGEAGDLVIDAQQNSRVIYATDAVGNLTLDSLTIANGKTAQSASGGGIRFDGPIGSQLMIQNSAVSGNTSGARGGGIYADKGDLILTNSTVSGNIASRNGGGIYSFFGGDVTLTNSTVSGNTASQLSGGGISSRGDVTLTSSSVSGNTADTDGGGIDSNDHDVILTNSTVSGNMASRDGGGIAVDEGDVILTNSSVSGNSASREGGGIAVKEGAVRLTNSTLSRNKAGTDGGGIFSHDDSSVILTNSTVSGNRASGSGGGIFSELDTTQIFRNSIIAGNDDNGTAPDFFKPGENFFRVENSIIGNSTGTSLTDTDGQADANGNFVGIDFTTVVETEVVDGKTVPKISDNGGLTQTIALLPNSPAIGAADSGLLAAAGRLVTPTSATSSTSADDIGPVANLIDATNITLANYETTPNLGSWFTAARNGGGGNDYFSSGPNPVLTFELGRVQVLTDIAIWGREFALNNDISAFDLEFSTDGGQTFSSPISLTKARFDATNNVVTTIPLGGVVVADFVRMTVTDNHFENSALPTSGAGDRVGFNEVRFLNKTTYDQRGDGFSRRVGLPDIGAFEAPFETLVVDSVGDGVDFDFSPGRFTLREAIEVANNTAGADEITFAPGISGSTILLTNGQLEVTDDLTITGPGEASDLVIDAQQNSRVLYGRTNNLSLQNLTITGGKTSGNGGGIAVRDRGGADASLVIQNSTISGNIADGQGGGISFSGSFYDQVTIRNSTISGNQSTNSGGGIFNGENSMTLTDSTVSGNTSLGFGGGISSDGSATLQNVSIVQNTSSRSGGGIFVLGGRNLTLFNSTVARNQATDSDASGGGVFNDFGDTTLINSTMVGNRAGGVGGGIAARSVDPVELTVRNSIIAGNTDNGTAPDFKAPKIPANLEVFNSIIGDTTGTSLSAGNGNILDVDFSTVVQTEVVDGITVPKLADNGGLVQTIALLPTSPAIDAGDNALALDEDDNALQFDQRGSGFDRIVDGSLNGTATVDLGAFEFTPGILTITNDDDEITENGGETTMFVIREGGLISASLVVTLTNSDTTEATVPTTITFEPGETAAAFNIIGVDDDEADGPQTTFLTASAVGMQQAEGSMIVLDDEVASLTVTIDAAAISESDGANATTATVTRDGDLSSELTVSLVSDDESEATVPATITIAAGEATSAPFNIAAIDDSDLDGTQTVTVTAGAVGLNDGADTVDVADDESASLTLNIVNAALTEGDTGTAATVTRDGNLSTELVVTLTSSDRTEATVPTTITIAAGQATSPEFTIASVDDGTADGPQSSEITAMATDVNSATETVTVADNDTASLTVTIAANFIIESAGASATTATVSRDGDLSKEVIVTLTSSDTTAATVPATITIAAGQSTSDLFDIAAVDDSVVDGTQTATITASATAFNSGSDTVDVIDNETPSLFVTIVADSFSESVGAAATTATVTRNGDLSSGLTVTLTSSDPSEATIPATITFAAGQTTSPVFEIAAVDDSEIDGTQTVTITATVAEFNSGSDTVDVTDDEVASLSVTIVADSFSESAGATATTATVTRDGDLSSDLVVTLTSSDPSEATVPATITIAAGQATSPAFDIAAIDDSDVDGTQTVTITAAVTDFNSGSDTVDVTDDEVASLSVTIAADSFSESAGATATTATVTRDGDLSSTLTVNLTSSDPTEATVPATITIAAGQTTSPAFDIAAIDDDVADGSQTVTVTAGATGFANVTDTVDVTDDDSPGFTVNPSALTVSEGGSTQTFTVVLNTAPVQDVVITVTNPDTGEATVDATTLTFTATNFSTPQTVTVTGIDDPEVDGDQTTDLTIAVDAAASDDPFDNLPSQTVTVTTTDDDSNSNAGAIDIDGDGTASVLSDGILMIRFLAGFRGDSLINGAINTASATRTTAAQIEAHLRSLQTTLLDVDGNGASAALTDGILAIRYLAGFRGDSLINNAIDTATATRTTSEQVVAHLESFDLPANGPVAQKSFAPGAVADGLIMTGPIPAAAKLQPTNTPVWQPIQPDDEDLDDVFGNVLALGL